MLGKLGTKLVPSLPNFHSCNENANWNVQRGFRFLSATVKGLKFAGLFGQEETGDIYSKYSRPKIPKSSTANSNGCLQKN